MATQRDSNRSELSPQKVAERIKEEGKSRLERGKSTAADQVDQVANALKSAGNELGGSPTLAAYANQLADTINNFGTRLRDGSIEDLAADMKRVAQRNPTMFIAGGLALGIVLARIVKASTEDDSYETQLVGSDFDSDLTPSTGYSSAIDSPTVDVSNDYTAGGSTPGTPRNFGG